MTARDVENEEGGKGAQGLAREGRARGPQVERKTVFMVSIFLFQQFDSNAFEGFGSFPNAEPTELRAP